MQPDDQDYLFAIDGSDPTLRVFVNSGAFPAAVDAREFAEALRSVLVARHDYRGGIAVTDRDGYAGFAAGQRFDGDMPDGWCQDDYEAVIEAMG